MTDTKDETREKIKQLIGVKNAFQETISYIEDLEACLKDTNIQLEYIRKTLGPHVYVMRTNREGRKAASVADWLEEIQVNNRQVLK